MAHVPRVILSRQMIFHLMESGQAALVYVLEAGEGALSLTMTSTLHLIGPRQFWPLELDF